MAKALIFATNFMTKGNIPVAKYISKTAKTDLFNLKDLMRLNLDAYDTIIFGTANNSGSADKLVYEFIQNNKDVLSRKKLYLYVLLSKVDDRTEDQVKLIADSLGVPDVVCFNKKSEDMNAEGFPSAVDDFIAQLG
ncbi:flavodoxin [methanogenic archaeon mixed culture ISO4-G1]|nr:flavodoxin [methanogenic archaeon mixed culture ISO4-G1]